MNNVRYLLRTNKDIEDFICSNSNKMEKYMLSVTAFIDRLTPGIWTPFLEKIPEKNIPILIGAICVYCDRYNTIKSYVEFNSVATLIRVIKP